MYKTNELFDLSKTRAADLLRECEYPWQALDKIGETILKIGAEIGRASCRERVFRAV